MDVFTQTLQSIFGERAETMTGDQKRMLRRLWKKGLQQGTSDGFNRGRTAGIQELGVLFSEVLKGERLHDVFVPSTENGFANMGIHSWVNDALQQIMDAHDLDSARKVAAKLEEQRRQRKQQRHALMNMRVPVNDVPPPPPDRSKLAPGYHLESPGTRRRDLYEGPRRVTGACGRPEQIEAELIAKSWQDYDERLIRYGLPGPGGRR